MAMLQTMTSSSTAGMVQQVVSGRVCAPQSLCIGCRQTPWPYLTSRYGQQRRSAVAFAAVPAAAAAAAVAATPAAAAAAVLQQPILELAAAVDEAPVWTLDQAVGLVFGGLLLALYLSSSQVDRFVARQQRRQLGLCEECGGLNEPGSCPVKSCPARQQL